MTEGLSNLSKTSTQSSLFFIKLRDNVLKIAYDVWAIILWDDLDLLLLNLCSILRQGQWSLYEFILTGYLGFYLCIKMLPCLMILY